jgi:hypothetical protein
LRFENETLLPEMAFFPVSWQILDIILIF